MLNLTLDGSTVMIEAPPRETVRLKRVPGTRYYKSIDRWAMPLTMTSVACLQEWPTGVGMDEDIVAAFDDLSLWGTTQDTIRNDTRPLKGREFLYPFQAAGVRFIGKGKRVLVADEMGTGKTVQAITAIDLADAYPALIICPNSLKHNWAKEVEMWSDATPVVIEGTATKRAKLIADAWELQDREQQNVVIINYESLVKHTKEKSFGNTVLSDKDKEPGELNDIPWQAVVVDEAHRIKSPKAHSTRAVWGVSQMAPYRIALTGTPVVNNPDDLWSIMHFLDPEGFPSRTRFRDRYCLMRPGYHGGVENMGLQEGPPRTELDLQVRPRFIRRTKMAVLPELPDKILSTRRIPLTPAQTKAYNQMVKNMMAELKSGILMATDPLTLLGRLRYVASAMPEVNEDLDVISLSTPSNKLNEVKDILEGGSGQLVVYGESRKLMELLQEELWRSYSVGMITGAVPVRVRQGYVDMFQRGELDIMLATTGAGAEGITLTAANRMVVVQESWSNVANKQAHDRIHRIGQDRGTEIITLISEGTVDEAVHRATVEKEGQLQALVRDPEWLMAAARGDL